MSELPITRITTSKLVPTCHNRPIPAPTVTCSNLPRPGNAGGEHTPIMAAELTADGMALVNGAETDRIELIRNDLSWESICTEGPWIVSRGEYLYLFYSGNMYDTVHYSVGVARATSISGPWEKKVRNRQLIIRNTQKIIQPRPANLCTRPRPRSHYRATLS
jgi:hypothetical protein